MMRIGRNWIPLVAAAVLCLITASHAGEGFITKVRGTRLTIDKGAEDGLEVGMSVIVIRPPEEAVIHPLTGENLGNPEIQIGTGEITKVSARAASIRLPQAPLLPVRPADIVRFTTLEEQMVMEQEMVTENAEQALKERKKIRGEASRLARNIKNIQATIKGLERSIAGLKRFDVDVVQPQFTRINRDIISIKEELEQLRETVNLMGSMPVEDIGGEMGATEEELEQLRAMIQEELERLETRLPSPVVVPEVVTVGEPMAEPGIGEIDETEEETPIYLNPILLGVLAALGLAGVAFWFIFMRMSGEGDEEDDEEEDDDELEDDDEEEEDDDEDIEIEEEDDIVVEETS